MDEINHNNLKNSLSFFFFFFSNINIFQTVNCKAKKNIPLRQAFNYLSIDRHFDILSTFFFSFFFVAEKFTYDISYMICNIIYDM